MVLNDYGFDTKNLILMILENVEITNTNLNVSNLLGTQFSYSIESTGDLPKSYSITPIPAGILLINNIISGTFTSIGTYIISMGVSGSTD